ncbi:hypothetical protein DL98DRAFT_539501 [Cadophora sp. DSE1049]|nr:hypothetical protein DL98DRAFT_539501 [Cadophora sp. DSE1049]
MSCLLLMLLKLLLRRIRLALLLANPKFILRMLLLDMPIQPIQRPIDLIAFLPMTFPYHIFLLGTSRAFGLRWQEASDCRAPWLEECIPDLNGWWWKRGSGFLGFALALAL